MLAEATTAVVANKRFDPHFSRQTRPDVSDTPELPPTPHKVLPCDLSGSFDGSMEVMCGNLPTGGRPGGYKGRRSVM